MPSTLRTSLEGRFTAAQARLLCYVLGPLSGLLMLHAREYAAVWSIRFHALHSILMGAAWVTAWSALRIAEAIFPWFLSTVADELQFALHFFGVTVWVCLMAAAYHGWRCAAIPVIHQWSVRLARRYERRQYPRSANALS